MTLVNGGYDEGYRAVPCFWGRQPGSLIMWFLRQVPPLSIRKVLDLGCGEGKNAAVFAELGSVVDAVECSPAALANAKRAFPDVSVRWLHADVRETDFGIQSYDLVIAYGLFHCLVSTADISMLINRAKQATCAGGHHIVCAFNDRSHDLRAHPHFRPTLAPHEWYVDQYRDWEVLRATDSDLTSATA